MGEKLDSLDTDVLSSLTKFTLPQLLVKFEERWPKERIAIREKRLGIWHKYDWSSYLYYTRLSALGMIGLGMQRGDKVGFIVDNQPEWLFSETGVQSLGGVTCFLFNSLMARDTVEILLYIRPAWLFVQNQAQVDKLLPYREELSFVNKIIYIDPLGMRSYSQDPWLMSFKDLLDQGQEMDKGQPDIFDQHLWQGQSGDTAIILPSPGSRGRQKQVQFTHANLTEMAQKWLESEDIGIGDNWFSMSPVCWIMEHLFSLSIGICGGITVNFPETNETTLQDFQEIGPNIIIAPPRFWEELFSKIRIKMIESGWLKRAFYQLALRLGEAVLDRNNQGHRNCPLFNIYKWIITKTVSRPLLDRIGCLQVRLAYTGGDSVSPDLISYFNKLGLNLRQAYGLIETSGFFQIQPRETTEFNTVGQPLPGTKVVTDDDKEILVSSSTNFAGYYQDQEMTDSILQDGWLRTGDVGYFDDQGQLIVLGRKEDLIRTKNGRTISPDFIETKLKFSPYIQNVVVWGQDMDYLGGLINIDFKNVGHWAEKRKIVYTSYIELSRQAEVESLIQEEVAKVNAQLAEELQVRKVILHYKLLDMDEDELTPTGKLRRNIVLQKYADLFQAMYSNVEQMPVYGEVRYRDGTIVPLESTVKVLSL